MIKKQSKRFLSALVSVIMLISLLPAFVLAADDTPKLNSESNAYIIERADDLVRFGNQVAAGKKDINAELADDIDLTDVKWTAISPSSGYATEAFCGTLDGNGHLIKGLNINSTSANQGLFGIVFGGTIKNLRVEGDVSSTKNYVGGIVGKLMYGTIENCSFSGSVSSKNQYVGGIAGFAGNGAKQKGTILRCVNTASVSSDYKSGFAGGIVGAAKYTTITDCYNTGNISGTNVIGTIAGKLNNSSVIENSYSIASSGEICGGLYGSTAENCFKDGLKDGEKITAELLSDAFIDDTDNINEGYPILKWQKGIAPTPKDPEIKIKGISELKLSNTQEPVYTTLTAEYSNTDDTVPVEWSVIDGSDIVSLEAPQNPSTDNSQITVFAEKPGKAVIFAKAGELSDTFKVTVFPFITFVELDKNPVEGEAVSARVFVFGGDEYNYDEYPEITIHWYIDDVEALKGENAVRFEIPSQSADKKLSVSVDQQRDKNFNPKRIISADEGKLEKDKSELKLSAMEIKEATTLDLPKTGNNGSEITWSSDNESIINSQSGEVTLPENGIVTVKLRAELSYKGKTVSKPFEIKVYSLAAAEEERNNKISKLEQLTKELGDFYKLYPKYGEDTNVLDMLRKDITARTADDVKASITKIDELNTGAGISENGDITYFYIDPNTAPIQHSALYKVTFELALDDAKTSFEVPVVIGWDEEKVKEVMNSEILSHVEIENTDSVTDNIELPKIADDKKWTLISWTSSDESAISISNENQQTADTLFNPYVGIVRRGTEDKKVTLTALFTFGFTDDVTGGDGRIILTKVFNVTVKALDRDAIAEIRSELLQKLDNGFEKTGIRDAVTGEILEENNGVYVVKNDIKYPTTRDFGVDGKFYPITITSGNDDVIVSPDVNNAARTAVIRPMTDGEPEGVTVTVSITDKNTSVSASKTFEFVVEPLTEEEINSEKELMNRVCESYFDGIKGRNSEPDNIDSSLKPFVEAYDNNGTIEWVRSVDKMAGHGIVPTALNDWEKLEAWRLFRSSNPYVINHETLKLSKKSNAKSVTIDSALSSETLGIYGKLYKEDPVKYAAYKPLEDLYYREVSASLVVRGYTTKANAMPLAVEEKINAAFELDGIDVMHIEKIDYSELPETSTAFDVFEKALKENGYTYKAKGSYVQAVTDKDGNTLAEFDKGPNSGWMFKVNGRFPDKAMSAFGLSDGDVVTVYYTEDYTKESDSSMFTDDDITDNTNNTQKSDTDKTEQKENDVNNDDKDNVPEVRFTDIKGHWAESVVAKVIEKGLMNGITNTEFAPDSMLTRAMFVTILYRLENEPTASIAEFEDVKSEAWYAEAVAWASKNGIVNGITEKLFAPNENITREQMSAIIYRYAQFKGYNVSVDESSDLTGYDDFEKVSEFAHDAILYTVNNKLMTGRSDKTINPKDTATRAEAAAVLMRMIDVYENIDKDN